MSVNQFHVPMTAHQHAKFAREVEKLRELMEAWKLRPSQNETPALLRRQA